MNIPADLTLHFSDTSVIGGAADGVMGVTEADGQITIIMNWNYYLGADATTVGSDQYDFETVVMHELGHGLGLGHSPDADSVMFAELDTGQAHRSLTANDLAQLDDGGGDAPEPLRAQPKQPRPAPVAADTAFASTAWVSKPSRFAELLISQLV